MRQVTADVSLLNAIGYAINSGTPDLIVAISKTRNRWERIRGCSYISTAPPSQAGSDLNPAGASGTNRRKNSLSLMRRWSWMKSRHS